MIWLCSSTMRLCECPPQNSAMFNLNSGRYEITVRTLKTPSPSFDDLNVVCALTFLYGHIVNKPLHSWSHKWCVVSAPVFDSLVNLTGMYFGFAPGWMKYQIYIYRDLRKLGLNLIPFPRVRDLQLSAQSTRLNSYRHSSISLCPVTLRSSTPRPKHSSVWE